MESPDCFDHQIGGMFHGISRCIQISRSVERSMGSPSVFRSPDPWNVPWNVQVYLDLQTGGTFHGISKCIQIYGISKCIQITRSAERSMESPSIFRSPDTWNFPWNLQVYLDHEIRGTFHEISKCIQISRSVEHSMESPSDLQIRGTFHGISRFLRSVKRSMRTQENFRILHLHRGCVKIESYCQDVKIMVQIEHFRLFFTILSESGLSAWQNLYDAILVK